jgi:hypothetical protein
MPQLMILMMLSGMWKAKARIHATRRIVEGRSSVFHVVMYERKEEEGVEMLGSIVPSEDWPRERKKDMPSLASSS